MVKDQSGSVVPGAKVNLHNPVTGYEQNTVTDSAGAYRFNNIPQNNYLLTAEAPGFAATSRTIDVRSSLPIVADISLDLPAKSTALNVTASAGAGGNRSVHPPGRGPERLPETAGLRSGQRS